MTRTLQYALLVILSAGLLHAQAQTLKRTTFKSDRLDFGMGGTVSLTGAANGSISVEGWQKAEIEITAEIENQAGSASDLDAMSAINGFVLDEGFGHVRIESVGVDNKAMLKRIGRKVSKELAASPYRINYKIRVPRFADLNISGGSGDFVLRDVDGTIRITFAKTNADLSLAGGAVMATFGEGAVDVTIPSRGWRGRFADIQLASGRLNLMLPPAFDGEVNAEVIKTGSVENRYEGLKPRPRSPFTPRSVAGKAGNGGVEIRLTVGDGTVTIADMPSEK